MFKNKINGKRYISSSVNLSLRFQKYFSVSYMNNELRKGESKIYRAILKYGLENFSLTILEYCEPSKCLEREDDYFKLLKAENNILLKAGSRLDHKVSEESRKKNVRCSERNRWRIIICLENQNLQDQEAHSQAIEVLNLQENTKTSYNFISEATIALNIPFQSIYSYLTRNQKKPYKKQYIF
jgi:hypothetical protein